MRFQVALLWGSRVELAIFSPRPCLTEPRGKARRRDARGHWTLQRLLIQRRSDDVLWIAQFFGVVAAETRDIEAPQNAVIPPPASRISADSPTPKDFARHGEPERLDKVQ